MRQKSAFGRFLMRRPMIRAVLPAFLCFCAMLMLHTMYLSRPGAPLPDVAVPLEQQRLVQSDPVQPPDIPETQSAEAADGERQAMLQHRVSESEYLGKLDAGKTSGERMEDVGEEEDTEDEEEDDDEDEDEDVVDREEDVADYENGVVDREDDVADYENGVTARENDVADYDHGIVDREDDVADDDDDEEEADEDKFFVKEDLQGAHIADDVTGEDTGHDVALKQMEEDEDDDAGCMPYILYDKPIKTGSTSAMNAIWVYLNSQNATQTHCNFATCSDVAQAVCDGDLPRNHMISHIHGNAVLLDCLRRKGYYIVTSIREPEARWKSTFKFAKALNRTHYGIPTNSTYEQFISQVPACALLHYYDRLGSRCGDQDRPEKKLSNRVRAILKRFDEVMDLFGGTGGEIYSRMKPHLQPTNVSPEYTTTDGVIDAQRLFGERLLYDELLHRSKFGVPGARKLCKTIGKGDSFEPRAGWVRATDKGGDTFVRAQ